MCEGVGAWEGEADGYEWIFLFSDVYTCKYGCTLGYRYAHVCMFENMQTYRPVTFVLGFGNLHGGWG